MTHRSLRTGLSVLVAFGAALLSGCQSTDSPHSGMSHGRSGQKPMVSSASPDTETRHGTPPFPGQHPWPVPEDEDCDDCQRPNDFARSAVPAPPGTIVNQWSDAMICSARQNQLVISRHEWFSGGNELGPEGRRHVASLAPVLAENADNIFLEVEPVQLQNSEDLDDAVARLEQLNQDRRLAVVGLLEESGLADADQRVFLVPLDRVGVHGIESPLVYGHLLMGAGRGGQGGARNGGGMGGGGMGGGGMGMGGGGFGGGGIF